MQIRNVRFIIAAITTLCAFSVYVSRVNLSIAIIAMVEDHHGDHHSTVGHSIARQANSSKPQQQQLIAPFNSSDNDNHPPLPLATENNASSLVGGGFSPLSSRPANETDGSQQMHQQQVREPLLTTFPTSKKSLQTPLVWQDKFPWTQLEQGHILGAFFYGYIIVQIPGARLAESVGAKWILLAASAGSAVISLTFPLSTQLNSIYLLMALRFVMGLCQSAFFPAGYVLFCRWLPERERSILLPVMFIGGNMGSISTYALSSYLISSSYGWPSVFYVSGAICSVSSLLWLIVGSSEPSDNWLISDEERCFIERSVENESSESASLNDSDAAQQQTVAAGDERCCRQMKVSTPVVDANNNVIIQENVVAARKTSAIEQKLLQHANSNAGPEVATMKKNEMKKKTKKPSYESPTPSWSKLITSVPIWTLILSMYGNEWSHIVIHYELPTYLNTALNFPIEQNGVINSFFQLSYSLASPVMSSLGAYLLLIHWLGMRKIHVRKLFQSLATFGQLICYISVPICGANRGLIIMFMFLAVIFKSCSNAGDIMVAGDLSPEYAGTIFAFANSFGNTAGFFVPLLTGVYVTNPYIREQWTPFWYTTAAIMCFSGLIFITFGETRRQDFSLEGSSDDIDGGSCNGLELKEANNRNKNKNNDDDDYKRKLMKMEANGEKAGMITSSDTKRQLDCSKH